MMKTKTITGWLLLLGAAAGGSYFFSGGAKPAAVSKPVAPVLLAQAEMRDMPLLLELTGRAEAAESVSLKARVDGQVATVPMQEGHHVKKGEVLVQLDPADFAARLAQAEANLARDQAQAAKVRADVERYLSLKQKGFVSDEKVGEVRTNAAAQEATVKASQAAAELARLQLSYATVRAPFDGVVGAKLVFPGTAVKINDTLLAVVNRIKPLAISFAVPEKYLPQVQAALVAGAMPVQVVVPGAPGSRISATARFLDNAVDTSTGTIRMKASLPNAEEKLAVGQFLNVSLELDRFKNVVTVPAEAVQQGPEGPYVYVAKADETVELRRVEVAAMQKTLALLAKGLAAGETVVVDGQLRLAPGARYRKLDAAGDKGKTEGAAKSGEQSLGQGPGAALSTGTVATSATGTSPTFTATPR